MTSPPRLALWLINLFSPDEVVPGDLLEEYATVVSNRGTTVARRWFWQQTGRSIVHLAWSQFCLAPWSTGLILVTAYAALWYTPGVSVSLAGALLARYPVYEYISAPVFWWIYEFLLGTIIAPVVISSAAARLAARREMLVTLVLAFTVLVVSGCFWAWHVWLAWPYFLYAPQKVLRAAFSLTALPMAVLVGGVIQRRNRSTTRLTTT
jgi:hypothetical protein